MIVVNQYKTFTEAIDIQCSFLQGVTYVGIGLAADRLPSSDDTAKLSLSSSQSSSASGIVYMGNNEDLNIRLSLMSEK